MTQSSARKSSPSSATFPTATQKLARLVTEITGVQLGERQEVMVESRLKKRMLELGIDSMEGYLEYVQANRKSETEILVSLLTTHHTYFFREFAHFQYLEKEGLPRALKAMKERGETVLRVWSAACSNGQEVYSLSMFLQYALARIAPERGRNITYQILGTDVAPQSVTIARNGVYGYKEIKEIPLHFLSNHWAKGTGEISDFVKAKKSIKDPCSFDVLNLLNIRDTLGDRKFDIIFCRNVFIYFTPEQIKSITQNLSNHLLPQGMLMIGISETLNGLDLPLHSVAPSTYVHKAANVIPIRPNVALPAAANAPSAEKSPAALRVLCVDDSPSILTLLKQVLKKEHGFEVVGTAVNGKDAMAKIKELTPDVMTLDIHMPEMDGIAYLQTNINKNHPPVVMISSVSRESSELALRALELGAADYVEKPALANLSERAEEIRIKLSYAFHNRQQGLGAAPPSLSLDHSFAKLPSITKADTKIRIVIAGLQDRKRIQELLRNLSGSQPPTVILMEGSESALPALAAQLRKDCGKNVELLAAADAALACKAGRIYLGDLGKLWDGLLSTYRKNRASLLVYGVLSKASTRKLAAWPKASAQILIEDLKEAQKNQTLSQNANDQVPATSFAYMSSEFLGQGD